MLAELPSDGNSLGLELEKQEANYYAALKRDEKFSVLKDIRDKIKALKKAIQNLPKHQDIF